MTFCTLLGIVQFGATSCVNKWTYNSFSDEKHYDNNMITKMVNNSSIYVGTYVWACNNHKTISWVLRNVVFLHFWRASKYLKEILPNILWHGLWFARDFYYCCFSACSILLQQIVKDQSVRLVFAVKVGMVVLQKNKDNILTHYSLHIFIRGMYMV